MPKQMNIDDWFATIRERYSNEMQCGKGCTACCHGLFDISLADADAVATGFQKLPETLQAEVYAKAAHLQTSIPAKFFRDDDPTIDQVVESANNAACPCLGPAGECLIYEERPLACRLEGLPMVDVHDGLFGDWCELNFKDGVSENAKEDLRQDYDRIDEVDEARSAEVALRDGIFDHRLVTFIPSVIADIYKRRASSNVVSS